jgi:hypothetical protein
MPKYQITAPDGRQIVVEGQTAPTEADAAAIFAQLAPAPSGPSPASSADIQRALTGPVQTSIPAPRGADGTISAPLGVLADIGLEAGGATGGQALGVLAAPYTFGASIPIGGAIGGGLGNYAAQQRRIAAGEQASVSPGELISSVLTGAIPGSGGLKAAKGTAGAIAKEGVKQAAAGLGSKTVETVIDRGELPTGTEVLLSTAIPAIGGAAAQKLQAASPAVNQAVLAAERGEGAVQRATLEAARKAGYVVAPAKVNPSATNRVVEGVAGKSSLIQDAVEKNQQVTNKLAKEALGLPPDRDITEAALAKYRDDVSEPYRQIAAISPAASADLQALRDARFEANAQQKFYRKSADPDALRKAQAAEAQAQTLETAIEGHAIAAFRPELIKELREARVKIAKSYDVENALNPSTGNISASFIAGERAKGRPLTGELANIANFADAFPAVARDLEVQPSRALTRSDLALMAGFGAGGALAGGLPGVVAGVIPPATRYGLLTPAGQAVLANFPEPFIAPSLAATAVRQTGQAAGGALREEKPKEKK